MRTPFDSAAPAASRAASAQHDVQVAGGQLLGVGARELEEPRDDFFEAVDFVHKAAERLVVEPDNTALPELGCRANAGQRVANLVGNACEQLAQGRESLAPPQVGLETVALGGLASDGERQPGGQCECQARFRPEPRRWQAGSPGASDRRRAGRAGGSSPSLRRRLARRLPAARCGWRR